MKYIQNFVLFFVAFVIGHIFAQTSGGNVVTEPMPENNNMVTAFICRVMTTFSLQNVFFIKDFCAYKVIPLTSTSVLPTTPPMTTSTSTPTTADPTTTSTINTLTTTIFTTDNPTTTESIITTTETDIYSPTFEEFSFREGDRVRIDCRPYIMKIVSASYGNSASCGPHDVTDILSSAANDMQTLVFRVMPINFGNPCPSNSGNELTGQYYCDKSLSYSSTYNKVTFGKNQMPSLDLCPPGRFVFVGLLGSQYVHPSCTVKSIPEFAVACEGRNSCNFEPDSASATGADNPPGCKNALASMFAQVEFECVLSSTVNVFVQ